MNFSNKLVIRTYGSPHTKNAYGYIQDIGWCKIKPISPDGVTNMFQILCCAKANGRRITGSIVDSTKQIIRLYLL